MPVDELCRPTSGPTTAAAVSIIVPTYNEAANIAELLTRLAPVAARTPITEVIFVDDSDDGTAEVIAQYAESLSLDVRVIHRSRSSRIGGLSGAVLLGLRAARSPWALVMDGDLQHPPEVIASMASARSADVDLIVASRYLDDGGVDGLSGATRRGVSKASIRLARAFFPLRLRGATDTMTGFFLVRTAALDLSALKPRGFKVLLEILGRHDLNVQEVPFRIAERRHGESKASVCQGMQFLKQLLVLRWDAISVGVGRRAVAFGTVGLVVMIADLGLFNILLAGTGMPLLDKAISSTVAIVASYALNRHWTWRDRPPHAGVRGLLTFAALSAVGALIAELCLLTSHYLLGLHSAWADNGSANVIGLLLGLIWRYWSYERWVFPAQTAARDRAVSEAIPFPSLPGLTAIRPQAESA